MFVKYRFLHAKVWEKSAGNSKYEKQNKNELCVMTRFRRRRRRGSSLLWIRWPWRFGSFCCWPTSSSRSPCGWWPASRLTSGTTMWTAAGWAAGVTTATTTCPAPLAPSASTRSICVNTSTIPMSWWPASSRCWPAATTSRWPTVSGSPSALSCNKDQISIPRYLVTFLRWPRPSVNNKPANLPPSFHLSLSFPFLLTQFFIFLSNFCSLQICVVLMYSYFNFNLLFCSRSCHIKALSSGWFDDRRNIRRQPKISNQRSQVSFSKSK